MISNTSMLLVTATLLAGASYSCDKLSSYTNGASPTSESQAADKPTDARDKADEKIAEAHADVTKATEEANAAAAKAADDANAAAAKAQATANEKIRVDNREVVDTQQTTRKWAQDKIDDVDQMMDSARVKAQTASPKAKTRFDDVIKTVTSERDALRTQMIALDTSETLDKSKAEFTARVDRVKTSIENIATSL
jgi:dGTP triphosphohydrolase